MLTAMQEHRATPTVESVTADHRDAYEVPCLERHTDWEIVTGIDSSAQ